MAENEKKSRGSVLASYYGKTLILSDTNYYIIKGINPVGETIEFDIKYALHMPSYLFAMAAMNEVDLDSALDYIHSTWFDKK